MRVEHGHAGAELGLDLGKRDFALRLDLKMDGLVLRLLLLGLRLMHSDRLIRLRLRLRDQQFWIGRRCWRRRRRIQQRRRLTLCQSALLSAAPYRHCGEFCRIPPNVSPNVHGNREYIVNAQAKEASKRLWTSRRKADVVIAR